MLPKAVVTSTDHLAVAAIRCAWSQWSSIGALTHLTHRGAQVDAEIVDVEALILGSLGLARREPRLRTLAGDWTVANSELLSIARVRALLEGPFADAELDIGELAHRAATEGGDARWHALIPPGEAQSVARRVAERRVMKAAPPRWRGARTLMLQLRRGFGVGVKPDLLAILIGMRNSWVDVATLCDLSRYSVAGVRRAADDMANAGFIETTGGHSRAYRTNVLAWRGLLPNLDSPSWRRRADGFALVVKWDRHLAQRGASHDSEFALAVNFSARIKEFWQLSLEIGLTQEPASDDPANAWASRNVAMQALRRWFEDRAHYEDEHDGQK